jgi:hypothetical protein
MLHGLNPIIIAQLKDNLYKLRLDLSTNYIKQLVLNYNCSEWTIYRHKTYVKAGILTKRPLNSL